MSLLVFIGGTRSGKSRAAEAVAFKQAALKNQVIVVVFGNESSDESFAERIVRHKEKRPKEFTTLEAYPDPLSLITTVPKDAVLLVDSLGSAISALMDRIFSLQEHDGIHTPEETDDTFAHYSQHAFTSSKLREAFYQACSELLSFLISRQAPTIIVSEEVGLGGIHINASMRLFADAVGQANEFLVQQADNAWFCIAGKLIDLSEAQVELDWTCDA